MLLWATVGKATGFDSKKILKAVRRAERKRLNKLGAFIRRRARSSMRKAPLIDPKTGKKSRKKDIERVPATAEPGKPPYWHHGGLRKMIFFAYDSETHSLVVGPVPYRAGVAPNLLEKGGRGAVRFKDGERKPAKWRGNPFMAPAGKKEAGRIKELLRGMVR